jgi:hypothetical protein
MKKPKEQKEDGKPKTYPTPLEFLLINCYHNE